MLCAVMNWLPLAVVFAFEESPSEPFRVFICPPRPPSFSFSMFLRITRRCKATTNYSPPSATPMKSPLLASPFEVPFSASYAVPRRESGDLPVYINYKNARSKILTYIRHVQGDRQALMKDLEAMIPKDRITKSACGVILRGKYANEVRQFLTHNGI